MNIERALFPKHSKLQINKKEQLAHALIVDQELDPIEVSFLNDGGVCIDTSDYQHISLSVANLKTLIRLIEEADKYYEKVEFEDEEF